MIKRILISFLILCAAIAAHSQSSDAALSTQSTTEIAQKPYSPTRANAMFQALINSKINVSYYGFSNGLTNTAGAVKLGGTINQTTVFQHNNFLVDFLNETVGGISSEFSITSTGTISGRVTKNDVNLRSAYFTVSDGVSPVVFLGVGDDNLGTSTSFNLSSSNGGVVLGSDYANFSGLRYFADYSADYTARSLVDKAYVDSQVGGSVNFANNGLSLSGDTVQLGGALTKPTNVGTVGTKGLSFGDQAGAGNTVLLFAGDYATGTYSANALSQNNDGISYNYSELLFNGGDKYFYSGMDESVLNYRLSTLGGNLKFLTGLSGTSEIERLSIDSVGNISMPNTKEFTVFKQNEAVFTLDGTNHDADLSVFRTDGTGGYTQLYLDSLGLVNWNVGGNFTVNTDVASGSGLERLKIDSVGNVFMPNLNGFEIQSIEGGYFQSNFFDNGGLDEIELSFGAGYYSSVTTNNGTKQTDIEQGSDGIRLITTGLNFEILTDISGGGGLDRLKIDSVGNITMPNTLSFKINGGGQKAGINLTNDPIYATNSLNIKAGGIFQYTQNSLTTELPSIDNLSNIYRIYTGLNTTGTAVQRFDIDSVGVFTINGRMKDDQGADVASVAGAITLGDDGNTFEITGTNAITLISNVKWQNGSVIHLIFTSTATLTDGTANSGTDIGMELAGNTNFVGSADDVVTLVLSERGGTQRWREVSRSVN